MLVSTRLEKSNLAVRMVREATAQWRRGKTLEGRLDCPLCGKSGVLHYRRRGHNGHIRVQCATPDCLSLLE